MRISPGYDFSDYEKNNQDLLGYKEIGGEGTKNMNRRHPPTANNLS